MDIVSQETGEKMQRVIEDMRGVSSLAACGMRSHRTNAIQKEVIDSKVIMNDPHLYQGRLTTLRVSSEAENEEPQPQNERGKQFFSQIQGEKHDEKRLNNCLCVGHGVILSSTGNGH